MGNVALEMINLSPPIGSKVRKIYSGLKGWDYNEGLNEFLPWYSVENPNLQATASIIEGITNIPVARALNKANNLEEALTGAHEPWQRAAMLSGWNRWNVGAQDEELTLARMKLSAKREEDRKEEAKRKKRLKEIQDARQKRSQGLKEVTCSGVKSNGKRCSIKIWTKDGRAGRCQYHKAFKDGSDTNKDGIKEYMCRAKKANGDRCKNKTQHKSRKCYAHR